MTDQQLLERFEAIVIKQLEPVNHDIHSIKKDLRSVKTTLDDHTIDLFIIKGVVKEHTKEIKNIKTNLKRANKTLNIVSLRYDERIVQCLRDIDGIKIQLGILS